MLPVVLRTARLELSVPTASDAQAIYEACQDPAIPLYTTVPAPYPREFAVDFVAQAAERWEELSHAIWAIRLDGTLSGMIGLHDLSETGSAELGFWVSPTARGRGIVREASEAVIDWGFSTDALELVRLQWRAAVGNTASARAAQALGFRFEGTLRKALRNGHGERGDGWIASLLATDDRTPQEWPITL
jgi:RimJ/RimL family protein N-acetyltransferase